MKCSLCDGREKIGTIPQTWSLLAGEGGIEYQEQEEPETERAVPNSHTALLLPTLLLFLCSE